MGIETTFQKFRLGLRKTRESLIGKVQRALRAKSVIDDEVLETVEEILLAGDVGSATTGLLIANIKKRIRDEKYASTEELTGLLHDEIARILHVNGNRETDRIALPASPRPFVIMVVGVNGVGKTTTIGKLAFRFRRAGHRVVLGGADTFRAAANEQLEIWAQRAGVELIRQAHGADPASVAFDTLSSAVAKKADVVIIDTAGRLHTKVNLMEELKKIRRVLDKKLSGAPHEILLVLDANTGQNALQQARQFVDAANVTGIVLTKLDGTAKGGIVLAVSHELKIPVKYIGLGEQMDDLQPFDRKAFVDALFG
ncbi:MAG: signal recognition particle-docking protein FtsY [Ignavibacteriales bacterium]|nr:signal recognition particle-docking protein FtsY [Ignavibacteriales bacterium]